MIRRFADSCWVFLALVALWLISLPLTIVYRKKK